MTTHHGTPAAGTATAAVPENPENEQREEQAVEDGRPALRLVSDLDDLEVPEGTDAQAPVTYRIHAGLAQGLSRLPGVFSERQPALAEVVEYSLHGDWTAHPRRRTAHLIGVILLCLPAGLAAVALIYLSRKPSRVLIALLALLLLGYAL